MRNWLHLLSAAATSIAGLLIAGGLSAQEAPASIKIGYVLSLSGPQADGALLTTVPNYRLWVEDVNTAGGLMLKKYGKRIPIQVTEIDDRSDNVEMVRLVERLMRDDKADIVLSPWGSEIDRPRILRELQSGTFQTVIGEIRLKGNRNPSLWHIGQWQNGEFHGVAPAGRKGARAPLFGK